MFLDRMNYLEVEEYLKRHDSIIIVTGSTENHGKHMPLGTDTMIPSKIAELVDERLGSDVVIAPPLAYGSTSDLMGFAGTLSLGPELLIQVLDKLCFQLIEYGFKHFIILNGHGGNSKAIEQVGFDIYKQSAILARVDWWLIAGDLNPYWRGGHGGAEETAGVMAVDPSLIKTEYINEGENFVNDLGDELPTYQWTSVKFKGSTVTIPRPIANTTDNGWNEYSFTTDKPPKANPEWGTEMLNAMADYISDFAGVFEKAPVNQTSVSKGGSK